GPDRSGAPHGRRRPPGAISPRRPSRSGPAAAPRAPPAPAPGGQPAAFAASTPAARAWTSLGSTVVGVEHSATLTAPLIGITYTPMSRIVAPVTSGSGVKTDTKNPLSKRGQSRPT